MTILYVDKEVIFPSFAKYYPDDGTIKIRKDFPAKMKDFLLVHETYHSTDKEKDWLLREVKANWAGFKNEPIGFFMMVFASLNLERLRFYMKRLNRWQK